MLKRVKTNYGYVEGVVSNAGFALFRGIPYAKPPVGNLRWKEPQELDKWEGVRKCDTYGPACFQYDRWSSAIDDVTNDDHPYIHIDNYPYPPKMSEDCLYLNIYTPAISENDKLPVCFYVHGGGLQQWYGSDYEYCGDGFAKEGCILVSITYRLNVFGYFAHPELAKENNNNASGNYGLLDQIKALKWVYENIEFFGGDKDNIMCFGQSAGGTSSLALLVSPLSHKYVKRVSLQSCGGLTNIMPEKTKDDIEKAGIEFMKNCGCNTIEEMRSLSPEYLRDINDKYNGMFNGFGLNVDGYSLKKTLYQSLIDGDNGDADMIVGCTADEGANNKKPFFGMNMCSNIVALAKYQLLKNRKPIYSYVFSRVQPGDDAGVPHSCDNRYQFKTLDGFWRPYTKEDYELADKMCKYWANFARCGDPNSADLEVWTPYTISSPLQTKLDIISCKMHNFNVDTNGILDKESEEILSRI